MELITWLRSKTYILALIREVQLANGQRTVAILRAVLTRWTAHYIAYCRLLDVSHTLKLLVQQDEMCPTLEQRLVTGDKKSRDKAQLMVRLIKDEHFWSAILR